MTVSYGPATLDARLANVAAYITGGSMTLQSSGTTLATFTLSTVSDDNYVLTCSGTPITATVAVTGSVNSGAIYSAAGVLAISSMSVGTPISTNQLIINNSSNSTVITAAQTASLLSGEIDAGL